MNTERKNWLVVVYAADETTVYDQWELSDMTQEEASFSAEIDSRTRGKEYSLVERKTCHR